ncbi:hypothetical protein [Dubosiella newyorkensis]|uniref:hypothetical protein n=2 Tax=Dubosiella newyorkensis TaxID=1862672 RepID=UPI0023F38E2C|nr:hypothetical protein [Dubosiella newyorkensis]
MALITVINNIFKLISSPYHIERSNTMKKTKKLIQILSVLSLSLGIYTLPIAAAENEHSQEIESEIQPKATTYSKTTVVASGTVTNVNCGFHPDTAVWRRVASYQYDYSRSYSINVSVGGTYASVSISGATSSGMGGTINVDQTRDSKLLVNIDYKYTKYRVDVYDAYSNQLLNSYYTLTATKTAERFLPYYR